MLNLVCYVSLCEGLRAGAGSLSYIVHVDCCGLSTIVIQKIIIIIITMHVQHHMQQASSTCIKVSYHSYNTSRSQITQKIRQKLHKHVKFTENVSLAIMINSVSQDTK